MTWSREHDRILAERCEGLKLSPRWDGPHYNTDPAAEKRAAEGWRLQREGREYVQRSGVMYPTGYKRTQSAECLQDGQRVSTGQGKAALAQALYEAVTQS